MSLRHLYVYPPLRCSIPCALFALVLVVSPSLTCAFELSGAVAAGGLLAGAKPRLAVSPQLAISWRRESGFLFSVRETASILPAVSEHGPGIYDQIACLLGYGSNDLRVALGPAASFYSMPACTATRCRRVFGFSVGGAAHVELYFAGPVGVAASVSVDWLGGNSIILPGGVAAAALAGPVLRWSGR